MAPPHTPWPARSENLAGVVWKTLGPGFAVGTQVDASLAERLHWLCGEILTHVRVQVFDFSGLLPVMPACPDPHWPGGPTRETPRPSLSHIRTGTERGRSAACGRKGQRNPLPCSEPATRRGRQNQTARLAAVRAPTRLTGRTEQSSSQREALPHDDHEVGTLRPDDAIRYIAGHRSTGREVLHLRARQPLRLTEQARERACERVERIHP